MRGAAAGPSAASITVSETLALLDGPFATLARGVAEGRYVLWLGSGISRDRLPGLRELVLRVLEFLYARVVVGKSDCAHRKALDQAVQMARLRPDEVAQVAPDDPPSTWPVIDAVLDALAERYSELLDIRVEGEPADYLLWDAVDVRATYGSEVDPDCEHLSSMIRMKSSPGASAAARAMRLRGPGSTEKPEPVGDGR